MRTLRAYAPMTLLMPWKKSVRVFPLCHPAYKRSLTSNFEPAADEFRQSEDDAFHVP